MWVEVRRARPEDLPNELELQDYARRSDPLLTYWFRDECIAIVGFIPLGVLTGTAYLWMHDTEYTTKHPLAVARLGRMTLQHIRDRYYRIVGECRVGSRSCDWLRWLGATFAEPVGQSIPFMIGEF